MKFTVIWAPQAENDLARLWLEAEDRGEISAAAESLDSALREDADRLGGRILFSPPLAVDFDVITDDCIVRVLSCWRPL